MMSKKTFSRLSAAILLLLTVSTPVGAQEISVEAARQTAAKFINEHAAKLPAKSRKGMMKAPPKAESLQLVYTQEDQLHESPALYVFEQPKQGGFVIASADERVAPIFGYFEEGNFHDAVKESCCFKAVLENFSQQIAYARENGLPQFTSTLNDDNDFSPIDPITRNGVSWGQRGDGINDYCPIDKNTGKRCLTGCVANTMAILMYHHQWPERGVGSHSYQWRETTLTANFGETTYPYELMGPVGSSETALLLYHCGVAVNMDYSSEGSGAITLSNDFLLNNGMKKFFRYNYVKKVDGDEYRKVSEIHDALSHNNPLCASGYDHQFLIDGYQPGGFIHLNLHSGFSNGYVHISGLKDGWSDYGSTWSSNNVFYDGGKFDIVLFVPDVPEEDANTITITKDNFEYAVRYDKATITKGTGTGDLVIPSTVSGENGKVYPVTRIGDEAFWECKGLTSVTIPNSVTSIGNEAFSGCKSLTSITIPNSVTSIGHGAFSYCDNLTSVTIPNSVTNMGGSVFFDCTYERLEVYMGSTVPTIDSSTFLRVKVYVPFGTLEQFRAADVWKDLDNLYEMSVEIEGVKYSRINANEAVVVGGGEITEIRILETITVDGKQYAVKKIDEWAFKNNTTITSVVIPNSIMTIGDHAFYCCYGLTSIVIPNSVTSIGYQVFYGCYGLTSVTIPNSVTSIGTRAFGYSGLTSVTIPNSVTSIGAQAFWPCSRLTAINVEDGNTTYSSIDGVLFNKSQTELIQYPQKKQESYNIPNSVTCIGWTSFYGCRGLKSVTIPNSVTTIGGYAFKDCSNLTSVTIGISVTTIERNAFSGTGIYNNSSDGVFYVDRWVCGYKGTMPANTNIVLPEGTLGIADDAFEDFSDLTSVTIPNSVTSIGANAFSNCSGLTNITIPNSVTSIESGAFSGCSGLTSVTIPNSVTSIGVSAFNGCSGLTSVTIGNSVTSIGEMAFYNCTGLQKVIVKDIAAWCRIEIDFGDNPLNYAKHLYSDENTEITDLVIPDGVTSIGAFVFDGCEGLTSITIPNSVKSIGRQAFFAFEPALTSVVSDIVFPFYLDYAVFPHNKSATLYVPGGTSNLYKSYGWGDYFKEIVEREDNKAETITQEGITYVVYRGEAQVVGVSGNPEDIVIPASISNEKGDRFSVTNIASNAFSNLYKVTSITIPNTITTIAGDLFSNYSLTTINVEEGNPAYSSIDGVLFNKDQTELIRCPRGKQGAYVIPNSVKGIGDNAFRNCRLTNVTIPNSVESIGSEAFYNCSGLTSVTLPSSLTSMGYRAFGYCRNLTSVISHIERPFDNTYFFTGINTQAILYVPVGTIEKYRALDSWNNYFKEIVEFDINGIESVTVSNGNSSNGENAPMYNLSGQRVGKNYKGIVIKNGKKIVVK